MRSSTWRNLSVLALAATTVAGAQSIQVYSELTRVDPFGEVVVADRGENSPREILSPALPRNASTSLHLVVSAPPGTLFNLYVGLNPDHAVDVAVYREKYVKIGEQWVPDGLEPVMLPYQGTIATEGIPGQTAQSFLLDLHVNRDSEVQRIKIEPEVSFPDRWARYPMEARIVETAAPGNLAKPSVLLPSVAQPADYAARRVLKQKLCAKAEKGIADPSPTLRAFIARDAVQDMAMASVVPEDTLWQLIGAADRAKWCREESPVPDGTEWYLRLRDRIVGAKR